MNANKTAFAMLLGVAFSLELTANDMSRFIQTTSNTSQDINPNLEGLHDSKHVQTIINSSSNHANFTSSKYTHYPTLSYANTYNIFNSSAHSSLTEQYFKQRHELIKRALNRRDIIQDQRYDLEILKREQSALNTLISLGANLSNNQPDIFKAVNALRSLKLKTNELNALTRVSVTKSSLNDALTSYNAIKDIKDSLTSAAILRKELNSLYQKSTEFVISAQHMMDNIHSVLGYGVMSDDIFELTSNSFNDIINNLENNIKSNLIKYKKNINNKNKNEVVHYIINNIFDAKLSIGEENEYLLDYDIDTNTISKILDTTLNNLDKVVNNKDKILKIILDSESNTNNKGYEYNKLNILDDINKKDKELNEIIIKLKPHISSLHFYSETTQINEYILKIDDVLSTIPQDDISMDKFIDKARRLDKSISNVKGTKELVKSTEQVLSYDYQKLVKIYEDAYNIATNSNYNKKLKDKIKELEAKEQKFKRINDLETNIVHMHIDLQNTYDDLIDNIDKIRALNDELNDIKTQIDKIGADNTDQKQMLKSRLDAVEKFIQSTQKDIDNSKRIVSEYAILLKAAKDEYNKLINLNLSPSQQNFYDNLKNSNSNYIVSEIISTNDESDIKSFISSLSSSLKTTNQILSAGSSFHPIYLNASLSTSTRLVKASNPYTNNLALAYAINKLSKDKFAISNNNTIAAQLNDYINSFKTSSNLYQSIMGGRGYVKSNKSSPLIYGITSGYDKLYDDTLLGIYASYAKSRLDSSIIDLKANHYNIGTYMRHYNNGFELDIKASLGYSNTNLKRGVKTKLGHSVNDGSYNSLNTNLELEYGYAYKINDDNFIKPIFGIGYYYLKNSDFSESGNLAMHFNKTRNKELSMKLGAEYRSYLSDRQYAYINLIGQKQIYKSSNDIVVNFIDSTAKFVLPSSNKSKQTYALMQTGLDIMVKPNLNLGINFGAKTNFKDGYYNGNFTIGWRW
ncbi:MULTISPECIES: autotransporter domain-containing protein [unclassified Campylobacter]|uniref:autotransporter domain-containing protein n=1 Tax=unclassified Campylobacter TaxID=2593542 RepID=UPI003D349F33